MSSRKITITEQMAAEIAAGGEIQTTVKDMPEIDEALRCSFPLIIRTKEAPDFPGVGGTAFALVYKGMLLLVTTKHQGEHLSEVGLPKADGTVVFVPVTSVVATYTIPSDDSDWLDIAILVPSEPVPLEFGLSPHVFDSWTRPKMIGNKAIFAVSGCPRTVNGVDYENRSIHTTNFITLGFLAGPSISGTRIFKLDLNLQVGGGAQGMSGSPIFRAYLRDDGSFEPHFAGIAIRGGETAIHFVEAEAIKDLLDGLLGQAPHLP